MSSQPIVSNAQGAILTIGMVVSEERLAIVEPYGCDNSGLDPVKMCKDLVDSWIAAQMISFLACLTSDAHIVFVSAEGMQDGKIPNRRDFTLTSNPGTLAGVTLPNNVAGLIAYYGDPADIPAGDRMRVGKTYMPALSRTNVSGDKADATLTGAWGYYADAVQGGFPTLSPTGFNWYRMLAVPHPRSTTQPIKRVITYAARGYVVTMKKRLVPR